MATSKGALPVNFPNTVFSPAALDALKKKIATILATSYSTFQNGVSQVSRKRGIASKIPNFNFSNFKFDRKNLIKFGLPVLLVLIVVFAITQLFSPRSSIQGVSNNVVGEILDSQELNREFQFPLRDTEGEETGRFTFIIESAETRKQIIVKGERATAVPGRVFLILNLKLVNPHDQGININTRNFVRISVNGDRDEWLAPDIHNDPVETQAISTKYTRLGLAVNENDKEIVVRVGEIDGDKEEIKLDL